VGNKGHCIAHMATTHCSEVRADMPSGMVPLRELESRLRPLHPGGPHAHTRVQAGTLTPHTQYSCLGDKRGEEHQEDSSSSGHQGALYPWPPLTPAR
jgi:hypothetical protein